MSDVVHLPVVGGPHDGQVWPQPLAVQSEAVGYSIRELAVPELGPTPFRFYVADGLSDDEARALFLSRLRPSVAPTAWAARNSPV